MVEEPIIKCINCGKSRRLFGYLLDEAATLTCPVCNTQFLLTAALKEPVSKEEEPLGSIEVPNIPDASAGPPAAPAAPAAPVSAAPAAESYLNIDNLFESLSKGVGLDIAISNFLGEEQEDEGEEAIEAVVWKGDLASFNTKLQSMVKDIGYDGGDLGDLIRQLYDDDALKMTGEKIELDLEKAKESLVKKSVKFSPSTPNLDGFGLDDDDVELEGSVMDGAPSFPSASVGSGKVTVTKALETYFA